MIPATTKTEEERIEHGWSRIEEIIKNGMAVSELEVIHLHRGRLSQGDVPKVLVYVRGLYSDHPFKPYFNRPTELGVIVLEVFHRLKEQQRNASLEMFSRPYDCVEKVMSAYPKTFRGVVDEVKQGSLGSLPLDSEDVERITAMDELKYFDTAVNAMKKYVADLFKWEEAIAQARDAGDYEQAQRMIDGLYAMNGDEVTESTMQLFNFDLETSVARHDIERFLGLVNKARMLHEKVHIPTDNLAKGVHELLPLYIQGISVATNTELLGDEKERINDLFYERLTTQLADDLLRGAAIVTSGDFKELVTRRTGEVATSVSTFYPKRIAIRVVYT